MHSPGAGYSGPPAPLKGLFIPRNAEKAKGSIPGGGWGWGWSVEGGGSIVYSSQKPLETIPYSIGNRLGRCRRLSKLDMQAKIKEKQEAAKPTQVAAKPAHTATPIISNRLACFDGRVSCRAAARRGCGERVRISMPPPTVASASRGVSEIACHPFWAFAGSHCICGVSLFTCWIFYPVGFW